MKKAGRQKGKPPEKKLLTDFERMLVAVMIHDMKESWKERLEKNKWKPQTNTERSK